MVDQQRGTFTFVGDQNGHASQPHSSPQKLLIATGWRVLLGANLGHFEPARAADEARYADEILGKSLLGIEIGNEPNKFSDKQVSLRPKTYGVGEYLREAETYDKVLKAATPGVAIFGPATGGTTWLTQIGSAARMFTGITLHFYPTITCPSSSRSITARRSVTELLSPEVRKREDEILQTLTLSGSIAGRPTRIGETNSDSCTASTSTPVFASALWSLDWILRATSAGASGLDFHDGFHVCAYLESPICAIGSQEAADAGDVTAQPEYYGLLAARQLEGGRFLPTHLIARNQLPDLTTWATVANNGTVRIAIDNFTTTGLAQPVSISIPGYVSTTAETLIAPSTDASRGIILGSAPVTGAGRWRAKQLNLGHLSRVVLIVRSASATIVTLQPKR